MTNTSRANRLSEAEAKLSLGDWLSEHGFSVFDERPNRNRPGWGMFQVGNIDRGKHPGLVVRGNFTAAQAISPAAHVAVEIKCGHKHRDILDRFDAILDYFGDYLWRGPRPAVHRAGKLPVTMSA